MKIVFISGKGGVGKSTIACATAIKAAKAGLRTILVSTDQVHSFRDIFGRRIGNELTKLEENLYAVEVDAGEAINQYFSPVMDYAVSAMEKAGVGEIDAWETATFPGATELACMRKVYEYYMTTGADLMVVDTASSSETIKLLKIPSVMKVFLHRLRGAGGTLMDRFAGIVERIFSVSIPRSDLIEKMVELTEDLESARDVFADPDVTRFRIVCTPERVVIRETERFATYISLLGFPVDGVFVNRVKKSDSRRVKEIKEKFHPLRVYEIPLLESEPCGMKKMEEFAETEVPEQDLTFSGPFWQIRCDPCEGGYVLRLPVRGVRKEDIDIYSDGGSLFVKLREVSREILLPSYLINAEVKEASLQGNELLIYFEREGEPL